MVEENQTLRAVFSTLEAVGFITTNQQKQPLEGLVETASRVLNTLSW
jgi:hypothetical protein